jgi:osmotically-inducible protein OsmY
MFDDKPMARFLTTTLALAVIAAGALALAGCATGGTAGEQIDDTWISSKVQSKITADPQLNPFRIDVDVNNGIVRLSGVVDSRAARSEAEKLARDTEGVRRVENDIQIGEQGMGDMVNDSWITSKIVAKLTADPELNPFRIDVDTDQGVVTLTGQVDSDMAKQQAGRIARETEGVRRVQNELRVR